MEKDLDLEARAAVMLREDTAGTRLASLAWQELTREPFGPMVRREYLRAAEAERDSAAAARTLSDRKEQRAPSTDGKKERF